jgi:hypothetical protein
MARFYRKISVFGQLAGGFATRPLLHSQSAFGIALSVAGASAPPIFRMRV